MEHKKWLTYWKKSLSDSLKADIEIEKFKHFEIENFEIDALSIFQIEHVNKLIDFEEERINRKKGVLDRASENWVRLDSIQVLISPFKIVPIPEHLVFIKDKKAKFPFWYYASVNRSGVFLLPDECFPVFQRKFLEPLADENTEFVFGSVERVDEVAAIGKEEYSSYSEYMSFIKELLSLVTNQSIYNYKIEGYRTILNGLILLPDEDTNAALSIIQLYEKILKEKHIPSLLVDFINLNNDLSGFPLSVSELMKANALHLGQMGFDYPVSISQRKSLYTFLQTDTKVFAVNGPPGTGKTTLLQSIVANKIVESAIGGNNPAVILACSANNQAVTNIIESFSKSNTRVGSLQGRWLPDIDGYATFLPANSKTEAQLSRVNYKKLNGEGLFGKIENFSYLEAAKDFFLQKGGEYLGLTDLDVTCINKRLQNEIKDIQSSLKCAAVKWDNYSKVEKTFAVSYCIDSGDQKKYYCDNILNEKQFEIDIMALLELEKKIISFFNNESFLRKVLCYLGIGAALRSRASEIRILLRDSLISCAGDLQFVKSAILDVINGKIELARTLIKAITEWNEWKRQNSIKGNPPRDEADYWSFENRKIDALKKGNSKLSQPNCFYDELDVTLRHKAFQLALHYWEGRWLLEIENNLKDVNFEKKGIDATKRRWNRQAMITPCFVSTFFMAPKFFSYYKFLKKAEDGKNIYDAPPLLEFIDLLIVDEAGQVSPEVGIATFSLAKQAVVVGDIKQIEPVWNITSKIDIGNLKRAGIIKSYDDPVYEKQFNPKGFLASTGSIMQMAQNACSYKEEGFSEKGVTLVEHRRCYDEIINYCNVLAYNGKLKPLKGKADKNNIFPPMYCIHVQGNSTVTNASRYNSKEAHAIVDWLKLNKQKIEIKYGKLENAVGIITPFVGQKNLIQSALKDEGFDITLIKLGTVHALQGAERPIILFSMVYGKGDSGTKFFDRDNKPNMLNVAVSRAKDSFIVFANTEILDKRAKTPSGILSNHLTYA